MCIQVSSGCRVIFSHNPLQEQLATLASRASMRTLDTFKTWELQQADGPKSEMDPVLCMLSSASSRPKSQVQAAGWQAA